MNGEQDQQKKLVDTTDCLEATGVFRFCKNLLFIILLLALLVQQIAFWLVNTNIVKAKHTKTTPAKTVAAEIEQSLKPGAASGKTGIELTGESLKIDKAAKKVTAETNQPEKLAEVEKKAEEIVEEKIKKPVQKTRSLFLNVKFKHISWALRFVNFILIITAVLYCLTLLFTLKVSLVGQLGGINHIARAFFISLLMVVLLLPWQRFFQGIVAGVIFTPQELIQSCNLSREYGLVFKFFYYLRFSVYWLLVLLLLLFAHIRSSRWAKAVLKRLEVI